MDLDILPTKGGPILNGRSLDSPPINLLLDSGPPHDYPKSMLSTSQTDVVVKG